MILYHGTDMFIIIAKKDCNNTVINVSYIKKQNNRPAHIDINPSHYHWWLMYSHHPNFPTLMSPIHISHGCTLLQMWSCHGFDSWKIVMFTLYVIDVKQVWMKKKKKKKKKMMMMMTMMMMMMMMIMQESMVIVKTVYWRLKLGRDRIERNEIDKFWETTVDSKRAAKIVNTNLSTLLASLSASPLLQLPAITNKVHLLLIIQSFISSLSSVCS